MVIAIIAWLSLRLSSRGESFCDVMIFYLNSFLQGKFCLEQLPVSVFFPLTPGEMNFNQGDANVSTDGSSFLDVVRCRNDFKKLRQRLTIMNHFTFNL